MVKTVDALTRVRVLSRIFLRILDHFLQRIPATLLSAYERRGVGISDNGDEVFQRIGQVFGDQRGYQKRTVRARENSVSIRFGFSHSGCCQGGARTRLMF